MPFAKLLRLDLRWRGRHSVKVRLLCWMARSDRRIAHTVASGLQVTRKTILKARIRAGSNPEVIPSIRSLQRPEFASLFACSQREFDPLVSVIVQDTYLESGFGAIVRPENYPIAMNIVGNAACNVGLAARDASLEDAEKRVWTKD